jgi:hypothetical protein
MCKLKKPDSIRILSIPLNLLHVGKEEEEEEEKKRRKL